MSDRPMIQVMDPCECGRHEFQPRYNFAKEGNVVVRIYLCDVCRICGHQVLAPFTVQQQLDAGVVDAEEVREAMVMAANVAPHVTLELALRVLVARRDEAAADSKERTGEAPNDVERPSGAT